MRFAMAVLLLAAGCGTETQEPEMVCDEDSRLGSYHALFSEQPGGSCGEWPDRSVSVAALLGSNCGALPADLSDNGCMLDADFYCTSGFSTTRFAAHLEQIDESGDRLRGLIEVSGSGCWSIYDVTLVR